MKLRSFRWIPFAFIFLFLASCGGSKIPEGEVKYELTYPYMDTDGLLGIVVPDEMTIVFKGTKMKTTIKKGSFFETIVISDESDNSIIMYMDMDTTQMCCELKDSEVDDLLKSQPKYKCKKTSEQDSVAGVMSTKYTVTSEDTLVPSDAWFTDAFTVEKGAWFSSYADVEGFPLVYDIQRYGMMTHATAVDFMEKEVPENTFEVEGEFTKVSFEEYEREAQKLFDILINW